MTQVKKTPIKSVFPFLCLTRCNLNAFNIYQNFTHGRFKTAEMNEVILFSFCSRVYKMTEGSVCLFTLIHLFIKM